MFGAGLFPSLSLVGEGGRKAGPGIQSLSGSLDQGEPTPTWVGLVKGLAGHVTSSWPDSENLVHSCFFFFCHEFSVTLRGPRFHLVLSGI